MKSRIIKTILAAALIAVLGGCAKTDTAEYTDTLTNAFEALQEAPQEDVPEADVDIAEPEIDTPLEVTFTDALGREVSVSDPQRVAVLLGSFADVWTLAGGEITATVKDAWTSFDLELSDDVINLGSFMKLDAEQLLATEPDFVIASAGTDSQVELREVLDGVGINSAYFDVDNFDDYLEMLDICTKITGQTENYEKYGTRIAAEIEEQRARPDGSNPSVLFIRAAASSVKAKGSEGTVGGEILADLDCVNIADSDGALLEDLSLEAIVAADPEYIFVTTQGDDTEAALANMEELLKSNPAWASLSAVQNGNYYEIDKSLYNSKPNARWAEAYKIIADILYP